MTTITIEQGLLEQVLDALDAMGGLAFIGHGNDFQKAMAKRTQADHAIRAALSAPATAPTQPTWHDAPTVPGLWVRNSGDCIGAYSIQESAIPILQGSLSRWFGPIPEDKQ